MGALLRREIPGKTLATKFLDFLNQNGHSSWTQLERLVELENRKARAARTWKVLPKLLEQRWVEKDPSNKQGPYLITNAGKEELERRKTYSLLAASAPYYFKKGLPLISFGEEITEDDQRKISEILSKYANLRGISTITKGKIQNFEKAGKQGK
jgi:DNA-binding PadR family transcriptional regulator